MVERAIVAIGKGNVAIASAIVSTGVVDRGMVVANG